MRRSAALAQIRNRLEHAARQAGVENEFDAEKILRILAYRHNIRKLTAIGQIPTEEFWTVAEATRV